ncbi:MAG: hypothetical protein C4334_05125 [Pyrinomonas sp.]
MSAGGRSEIEQRVYKRAKRARGHKIGQRMKGLQIRRADAGYLVSILAFERCDALGCARLARRRRAGQLCGF